MKEFTSDRNQFADILTNDMIVPESKVNLAEKDIEEYLFQNPFAVRVARTEHYVDHWIKRQYQLPSGTLDLLGVTALMDFVVVEVKNVAIDSAAVTQVNRYGYDIWNILVPMIKKKAGDRIYRPNVHRILVGKSIDSKTMREAEAAGVEINVFSVNLKLEVNNYGWSEEFHNARSHQYAQARQDTTFVSEVENYIKCADFYAEKEDAEKIPDQTLEELLEDVNIPTTSENAAKGSENEH
jgi:RecB family endonuclease NucS